MKEPTKNRVRGVRRRRPSARGVQEHEADRWRGGIMAPASSTSGGGVGHEEQLLLGGAWPPSRGPCTTGGGGSLVMSLGEGRSRCRGCSSNKKDGKKRWCEGSNRGCSGVGLGLVREQEWARGRCRAGMRASEGSQACERLESKCFSGRDYYTPMLLWLTTRDENGTDIFRPYSIPNLFREVQIYPYSNPNI